MKSALLLMALLAASGPVYAAESPPRIVSLAPHLTELSYAAGAGGNLVGTVEYSDYPEAALSLPRVGDAWRVDLERLLLLRPDVVLAWASGTPDELVARIRALRLQLVMVRTFRLQDVAAALRQIGRIAGTAPQAERAADRFEAQIERLRRQYEGAKPLSVFVQLDDRPLYTVNGTHIIDEIIRLCGGRNIFADLPQLAPAVSLEAVLALDPQVILSTDDTITDPQSHWSRWTQLAAVRAGTIYALSSDTITRPTPRLEQGIDATCAAMADARTRLP